MHISNLKQPENIVIGVSAKELFGQRAILKAEFFFVGTAVKSSSAKLSSLRCKIGLCADGGGPNCCASAAFEATTC